MKKLLTIGVLTVLVLSASTRVEARRPGTRDWKFEASGQVADVTALVQAARIPTDIKNVILHRLSFFPTYTLTSEVLVECAGSMVGIETLVVEPLFTPIGETGAPTPVDDL